MAQDVIKPPRHVAIIMDGNGRWAAKRGLPRSNGHYQGVKALQRTAKSALAHGVSFLTVYAFSTENWQRPQSEVNYLLDLMRIFIRTDLKKMKRQGVRVIVIGERETLDPSTRALIDEAEQETAANSKLVLIIAFNYGGRSEIVRATKRIIEKAKSDPTFVDVLDEASFAQYLDTGLTTIPDVDLLIRTGGEQRISNFLLWQCAYAEFVFFDEYWPDFSGELFTKGLHTFTGRNRRFGTIAVQNDSPHTLVRATG